MDIKLHFQEKGSGEAFIFLHGNGSDSCYFKNQIEYFSRNYHVLALDTRGHGMSPRGSAPFTIQQFSWDLYDFMKTHQISKAVILGFSDGANIAIEFAIKHPHMVKALILNGGNLNTKGIKQTIQIPIEIGYKITKCFAAKSPHAKKNTEMLGLMVNDPNIELDQLSQITAPTLVICGTRDMIKESHTKEIANNIPGAKLVIIKGDHFIANKRPAEFNYEVDAFLTLLSVGFASSNEMVL
ncbi:MAG: alpha/beta hydrolase [Firmicutes bacterium]|nr:alpha/beta hydrolase [Bacillota bacterium]